MDEYTVACAMTGQTYTVEMQNPIYAMTAADALVRLEECGYAVVQNVSDEKNRDTLINYLQDIHPQRAQYGWSDLYHDDTIAQLRQDVRLIELFETMLNCKRKHMLVTFESAIHWTARDHTARSFHPRVNANPEAPAHIKHQLRGVLALCNMNENVGTFAFLPDSAKMFKTVYGLQVKRRESTVYCGNVPLGTFKALHLKAGDFIIWDARTTFSPFRLHDSDQNAGNECFAMPISFMSRTQTNMLMGSSLRDMSFKHNIGFDMPMLGLYAREPLRCHKTFRNKEVLTPLGKQIYAISCIDDERKIFSYERSDCKTHDCIYVAAILCLAWLLSKVLF
jgi:hypothetical protein